jgi:hypothetical protein
MSKAVNESRVTVEACKAGEAGCANGDAPAEPKVCCGRGAAPPACPAKAAHGLDTYPSCSCAAAVSVRRARRRTA